MSRSGYLSFHMMTRITSTAPTSLLFTSDTVSSFNDNSSFRWAAATFLTQYVYCS